MFKSSFKSNKNKAVLGIYLRTNEVIVLCLKNATATFQDSVKVSGFDGWGSAIASLVTKHKLKGAQCQLVLSNSYYQKYTIDKPQVPEKELRDAIPWALKDIINDPIHEIVNDYYNAPALPNTSEKLNVITSKRSLINELVTICKDSNLSLHGISIEEMALCNLFDKGDEDSILLSIEAGSELSLLAISDSKLLFQRRLRGFNELSTISDDELDQLVIDNLSLELQRSLDYLVSQLKQTEIKRVIISSPSTALATICSALNQTLSLNVLPFENQNHIANISLTALGGALEIGRPKV